MLWDAAQSLPGRQMSGASPVGFLGVGVALATNAQGKSAPSFPPMLPMPWSSVEAVRARQPGVQFPTLLCQPPATSPQSPALRV